MTMKVYDIKNNEYINNNAKLMALAGLEPNLGFEAIAIQDDGQPIVCDKWGNFSYLDINRYQVHIFTTPSVYGETQPKVN